MCAKPVPAVVLIGLRWTRYLPSQGIRCLRWPWNFARLSGGEACRGLRMRLTFGNRTPLLLRKLWRPTLARRRRPRDVAALCSLVARGKGLRPALDLRRRMRRFVPLHAFLRVI